MAEVWILGGSGRSGRAITAELRRQGVEPVLVGRDAGRLATAAAAGATGTAGAAGAVRTLVADDVEAMAAEIRRQRPAVVVNTVGPFTRTAGPLVRACLPTSHYLDLANDLAS